MPQPVTPRAMRKPDVLGLLFLGLAIGLIAAASVAAVWFGCFKGWGEWALFVAIGLVCVVVPLSGEAPATPRNTKVHGDARLANEGEAQRAARGAIKSPHLHEREFPD